MNNSKTIGRILGALGLLAALAMTPSEALADVRAVNCGLGQKIGTALTLPAGTPLIIQITGTCNENVVIRRDDVTLQGNPTGTVHGVDPTLDTIHMDGTKRTSVINLEVTGGRNGVFGENDATFTVQGSSVHDNVQSGIVARAGSTVTVASGTHADHNGLAATADPYQGLHGVVVSENASLIMTNSFAVGNGGNGVTVTRSSSARIGRTPAHVVGPNTITGNGSKGGSGVLVFDGSYALVDSSDVSSNLGTGINADLGSSVTVINNTVLSNQGVGVSVSNASGARIGLDDRNLDPRLATTVCTPACTNAIRLNTSDGVQVTNGSNANLRGNLIQQNGGDGVNIGRATGRLLGDNLIATNALSGVVISGSLFQGQGNFNFPTTRDAVTGNGTAHDPNNSWGILILNGGNARLEDIVVSTNFLDGIFVFANSGLDLRGSTVSGNGRDGVGVFNHSATDLRGTTITGHPGNGISVTDGSSVRISGSSTIQGNSGQGVSMFNGSTAEVTGSLVERNGLDGINVNTRSSVNVSGSTIHANGRNGMFVFNGSSAQFIDSVMDGNGLDGIGVNTNSSANLLSSTPTSLTVIRNHANGTGVNIFANSAANLFRNFASFAPSSTTLNAAVSITSNRAGISCTRTASMSAGDALNTNTGASGVTANTLFNFGGTVLIGGTTVSTTTLGPAGGNCL
jgi:parallel beta helix pectate lyase-like protein